MNDNLQERINQLKQTYNTWNIQSFIFNQAPVQGGGYDFAIDHRNFVYISPLYGFELGVYTLDGQFHKVIERIIDKANRHVYPQLLAFNPTNQTLWMTDVKNFVLHRFHPVTETIVQDLEFTTPSRNPFSIYALTPGPAGSLFVLGHEKNVFSPPTQYQLQLFQVNPEMTIAQQLLSITCEKEYYSSFRGLSFNHDRQHLYILHSGHTISCLDITNGNHRPIFNVASLGFTATDIVYLDSSIYVLLLNPIERLLKLSTSGEVIYQYNYPGMNAPCHMKNNGHSLILLARNERKIYQLHNLST